MSILHLGIDTSNYKTSVALIDETGSIIAQKSELLDVPQGKRGLRQSDAFFMHSNRLPAYLEELFALIDPKEIISIGVSERPRRVEGSYMPCFLAGVNAASEIASALRMPVFRFSHQEGHAAAVMENDNNKTVSNTLFFHLSGGTTEALICSPDPDGYTMEIAGGTRDISIGQLLDRFGVASGLPFPSGRVLDDIAFQELSKSDFDLKSIRKTGVIPKLKCSDGYFNLSGAETRLLRFAEDPQKEYSMDTVASELFVALSELLINTADHLKDKYGSQKIYMAGGVASSRTFRAIVNKKGLNYISFGTPELSGDNAVGIALLAKRKYETGNRITGK